MLSPVYKRAASSLALALGLSSLSGCVVYHDDAPPVSTVVIAPAAPDSYDVDIDTNATLDAELGAGVGIFVEYSAGGHWAIWTSSDLNIGGYSREFDIIATVVDDRAVMSNVTGDHLVSGDTLDLLADNQLQLVTLTSQGDNGVSFDTDPGVGVEIDVLVDGVSDSRIIYWVGGGVLHTGAPSNPVAFWPTSS